MTEANTYPLKFQPIYKEKIWGGDRLRSLFAKDAPQGAKIGESWEISDYQDDPSVILNGQLAGNTLRSVLERWPVEFMGKAAHERFGTAFPLLLKIIDAQDILSVQVHPDEEYIRKYDPEGQPKTEAWYVLHATADAHLFRGLTDGTTRAKFEELLQRGELEKCLRSFPVQPGDAIFLPAGMVHAIGEGVVLVEIQQSSDSTYRVYDWNRMGADGSPRDLHVEHALGATDFDNSTPDKAQAVELGGYDYSRHRFVDCQTFVMDIMEFDAQIEESTAQERFAMLFVIDGEGSVVRDGCDSVPYKSADSLLLPAHLGTYHIRPSSPTRMLNLFLP